MTKFAFFSGRGVVLAAVLALVAACSGRELAPTITDDQSTPDYLIGAGDNLSVFVWRNPELGISLPVRPDGKISAPLIEDLQAADKTPTQLARDIEEELKKFIQDPIVTVIVTGFVGPFDQQVRVVGEAAQPASIPYRDDMTVLDVMISVGGLTQFAAGNRTVVVRRVDGQSKSFRVRLDDLLKDGDVSANVEMLPGDVVIVPQSFF